MADSSGLLNDAVRKSMEGLGVKQEGFVLVWWEGDQMHATANVPWKLIASKIPWNKMVEMMWK